MQDYLPIKHTQKPQYYVRVRINLNLSSLSLIGQKSTPTWLISSTTLNGHLVSSCRAIIYSMVDTLRSPPL